MNRGVDDGGVASGMRLLAVPVTPRPQASVLTAGDVADVLVDQACEMSFALVPVGAVTGAWASIIQVAIAVTAIVATSTQSAVADLLLTFYPPRASVRESEAAVARAACLVIALHEMVGLPVSTPLAAAFKIPDPRNRGVSWFAQTSREFTGPITPNTDVCKTKVRQTYTHCQLSHPHRGCIAPEPAPLTPTLWA